MNLGISLKTTTMKNLLTILFALAITILVFGQNGNNQMELIKLKMTKETVIKIIG